VEASDTPKGLALRDALIDAKPSTAGDAAQVARGESALDADEPSRSTSRWTEP
jgi:hypothetical protein